LGTTCESLLELTLKVRNRFVEFIDLAFKIFDLSEQSLDLVIALQDGLGCHVKLTGSLCQLLFELLDLCLELGFHGFSATL